MERVDTRLNQSDIDEIKKIAQKEGHSQSSMMRKLIKEALETRKAKK